LARVSTSGRALQWLRTSLPSLGDLSPIQLLMTDAGARAVQELLIAIEHGQFN